MKSENPEEMRKEQRQKRMESSPAFADGKFHNQEPTDIMRSNPVGTFWRFLTTGSGRVPERPLPIAKPAPLDSASPTTLSVTWLGHSTLLLNIEGHWVLCDPVWAERSSPMQFIGPRRFHPPPLPLSQLPMPDIVLISHNHYDHLDRSAILNLTSRGARFAVPQGVGEILEEWGVPDGKIAETDWWERIEIVAGELALVSIPSRHFSGRSAFDRDKTLWSAWVILGKTKRVFFGGDGGLYDVFNKIGEQYGPFDLTALEIGAYDPAWGDIHMGPVNAIEAHRMLRGKWLLPIHWGTFNLGLHNWNEPADTLVSHAAHDGTQLSLPRIGETFVVGRTFPAIPWWREVDR